MTKLIRSFILLNLFIVSANVFALEYKEAKMSVWKKGEALFGEEFTAASEEIIDYLETLERPTDNFKSYKYLCQVKSRTISPRAWSIGGGAGGSTNVTYTYITHVYGLKDCIKQ